MNPGAQSTRAYTFLSGILLACSALIFSRYQTLSFRWQADQGLIHDTGTLALGLFCAALLCTPIRNLLQRLGYDIGSVHKERRLLGLSATAAAFGHAALVYQIHIGDAPLTGVWFQPYAQAGTAALIILATLALTSFTKPTRLLKIRHWKTLHRLVHIIFFLLLLHVLLGPHAGPSYTLALFAVVASISWIGRLNP
ncbi:MAG: hypothetical protein HOK97_02565 [Deltaproteobacteria bacterium]|jgi:DMSO/TMAO reductase YedYZ heme-binding membrane subunit|nr:hypothetical protein [Deltaproteobacteria bacterium]